MAENSSDNLVWVDMEMSGLNPETDVVLEIASIITNANLDILAEGPALVIHQPASLFEQMDEWCQTHHTKSGLWDKVLQSPTDLSQAESETLAFIRQFTVERKNPLCGNSIHQDRLFINRYFPSLDAHLHYRMIDVSSIKELAKRWYPAPKTKPPVKRGTHRALDDIKESIEELKYYRQVFFREPSEV